MLSFLGRYEMDMPQILKLLLSLESAYVFWVLLLRWRRRRRRLRRQRRRRPELVGVDQQNTCMVFNELGEGDKRLFPAHQINQRRRLFSFHPRDLSTPLVDFPSLPALALASPSPILVEGSHHGVICISEFDPATSHSAFYLSNPSLAHSKKLPPCPCPDVAAFRLGAGHDPASDDFKVVCVSRHSHSPPLHHPFCAFHELFTRTSRVSVYSLHADRWTTADAPMPPLLLGDHDEKQIEITTPDHCSPVVIHGHLHWKLVYSIADPRFPAVPYNNAVHSFGIVAFRLSTEVFSLIKPPTGRNQVRVHSVDYVGSLFGCLSLVWSTSDLRVMVVWIMREYGVAKSWSMLAVVDTTSLRRDPNVVELFRPLGFANNKYLILACGGGGLYWYNLAKKTVDSFCGDNRVGELVAEYVETHYPLL